jgi:hypothetical protein
MIDFMNKDRRSKDQLLAEAESAQFETTPCDLLKKCMEDWKKQQDPLILNGGLLGPEESFFDFYPFDPHL